MAALSGGFLWSFGLLGKRYGVDGVDPHLKAAWSAIICLFFSCGCLVAAMVDLFSGDPILRAAAFRDPEFRHRLPVVGVAGTAGGIAGVLAIYALALSDQSASSALVSVILNGVYTVSAPVALWAVFGEDTSACQWMGVAVVSTGVILMDSSILQVGRNTLGGVRRLKFAKSRLKVGAWNEKKLQQQRRLPCGSHLKEEINYVPYVQQFGSAVLSAAADEVMESQKKVMLPKSTMASHATVFIAVIAALLCNCSLIGKRYVMKAAPKELMKMESAFTLMVLCFGGIVSPLLYMVFPGNWRQVMEAMAEPEWRRRLPLVALAGTISGLGSIMCIFSLGITKHSALISTIQNGTCTVLGALLIALTYRETLSKSQIIGVSLVLAGIVLMEAM
jgi:drug/metabolite transporter (DMT)-like permease